MTKRMHLAGVAVFAVLAFSGCNPAPAPQQGDVASSQQDRADTGLITTPEAFEEAVKAAQPGDRIILADGVWTDFDALFHAEGTADNPIRLEAETPGGVVLSGQSSLRLAGQYLIVSVLVFKDGYTPRNEVIGFRKDS